MIYKYIALFILFLLIPSCIRQKKVYEEHAIQSLKQLNGMFKTWKKKGIPYTGRRFPHAMHGANIGNTNVGKFAGLYYEYKDDSHFALIANQLARADFRADGNTNLNIGNGSYIASHYNMAAEKWEFRTSEQFLCEPYVGYWFGLMNNFQANGSKIAYNFEYAKNHYALIAIPAIYGEFSESTYIMNESGVIYKKDLGKAKYIDTYPGPDPTKYGWEKVE